MLTARTVWLAIVFVLLATIASLAAAAEVVQVWHCELNEGTTEAEEKAVNDRWVQFVNDAVEGGGIRSFAGHPIVGSSMQFIYVDTFPNLQAWTEKEAALQTEEGQAVEQALEETATCESSSLYRVVRSE